MASNWQVLFLLVCSGAIFFNNQAEALKCYSCLPSRTPGVQFPDCITNEDNHGQLIQCPANSDVCLKTEVVVNGVAIHERECGISANHRSSGGRPDFEDHEEHSESKTFCREMEGRRAGEDKVLVCTCDYDG